jgi:integrase/recombinase XerD
MPEALDRWTEGYLSYLLDVARKSPGTVRDVRCTLRRVRRKMDALGYSRPLWELSLRAYLAWLEEERRLEAAEATLSKSLSHVRGLLDYAWRSGRTDRNVLEGFRLQESSPASRPRCLSVEEARRLVQACPSRSKGERRDRLMVLLLYGCGLRTGELCRLRIGDVRREEKELFLEQTKGDKQRQVPIPAGVYTELLAYLLERGGRRGPLFRTSCKKRAISEKEVGAAVKGAARRAGLEEITPKVLRHSYATHLMERGVDLAVIAALMGHRSPRETGVYLHVLGNAREQAVQQLSREATQEEQQ